MGGLVGRFVLTGSGLKEQVRGRTSDARLRAESEMSALCKHKRKKGAKDYDTL